MKLNGWRVGQVWAHKRDIRRIYLLVSAKKDDSNPDVYMALNLYKGTLQRFSVGHRTKLRFKRLA